jgi:hypothetical protein
VPPALRDNLEARSGGKLAVLVGRTVIQSSRFASSDIPARWLIRALHGPAARRGTPPCRQPSSVDMGARVRPLIVGIVLMALVPGGCTLLPPPFSEREAVNSGPPAITCGPFLGPGVCDRTAAVSLDAVGSLGHRPVEVWVLHGIVACAPFDPLPPACPQPAPPDGGMWLASSEVAFSDTDEHALVNVAQVGERLVAEVVAVEVPPPGWSPPIR